MNIAKQINPQQVMLDYEYYNESLSGEYAWPVVGYDVFKVNDRVSILAPLTTGKGRRSTFYGYIIIHARVLYVDSAHLLYNVDNVFYGCLDEFKEKFSTYRMNGLSYWYDFRSRKERINKSDYPCGYRLKGM